MAHNNLGVVQMRKGRFQEAINHYYEALRIKPEFAEAHNNLGLAFTVRGNLKKAIAHYSEALRIEPDLMKARKNLERCLRLLGQSTGTSETTP